MWSTAIPTTLEPLGQLQPALTEIRHYKDYKTAVEDENKGNILKSCEDKEAEITMSSIQARERFF